MRRGFANGSGSHATVALLVVLIATIGLAGMALPLRGMGVSHATLSTPARASGAATEVLPVALGPVDAQITITNAPGTFAVFPYTLNWSIAVTNGSIAPGSTWMAVSLADVTGSGVCVQAGTCPVGYNQSVTDMVASGVTTYSYTITSANVSLQTAVTIDEYLLQVWVTLNNTVTNSTFGSSIERFLVPALPGAGFVAPLPGGGDVSTGNVTVGVNYTGSFIQGATVSIYQGTSSSDPLVFSAGVFAPGPGAHTVIAQSSWYVSTPGQYLVSLQLQAPYAQKTWTFTMTLNVIPAGQTVYENSSSYHNSSLIPGLSPAVGGTVLLVVGLIVGIVVAMALGRMVWGGAKATPAQPWQAKPAGNECSVCHQSFATEAELKEHSKTAHGM